MDRVQLPMGIISSNSYRCREGNSLVFFLCLMLGMLCCAHPGFGAPFGPAVKITDTTRKYQLSRTSDRILAVDSKGLVHFTYWSGGISTTPGSPSYVYYRNWSVGQGWSSEESIDNSTFGSLHVGGRHPSLAVTSTDGVFVVWHDHRHCIPQGNWINNVEIYADMRPYGGSFSPNDIRLTQTSKANPGDNGYVPKVISDPDGDLTVVWYDYHFNSDISDLFRLTFDPSASIPAITDLSLHRITDLASRGNTPPFTVPDIAADSTGNHHLVWAGGLGSGVNLYYSEISAASGLAAVTLFKQGGTDFFDPPHIDIAPDDTCWVVYSDKSNGVDEDLVLLKKTDQDTAFATALDLADDGLRQYHPDLAIDSEGLVHLVWIDEAEGDQILYARYNPSTSQIEEKYPLTNQEAYWMRPSIEADAFGNLYVVWEEDISASEGDIWFATTRTSDPSAVRSWMDY